MIEIKNFKPSGVSSQWHKSEKALLEDEGFQNLKLIYDYLKVNKFCYVRVLGGDYDASVAKFTIDEELESMGYKSGELYYPVHNRDKWFNVKYHWEGRLSWKGKRNNPKFRLMDSTCEVLLDYTGEEIFKRFDLKKEGQKLLSQEVYDIDGNKISKGDEVLYMNLRYGSGGKLCHGVVKDFKAHSRDGYVSVIISNKENLEEESECRQPYSQVYKKYL